MVCKKCGKELQDESSFCWNCGEIIEKDEDNTQEKVVSNKLKTLQLAALISAAVVLVVSCFAIKGVLIIALIAGIAISIWNIILNIKFKNWYFFLGALLSIVAVFLSISLLVFINMLQ